ncbi:TIM44-related membrane protein TimA [Phenylobacterium immobile]|uniref:TIM44-related membrane protein TimA n=1 Tax=Phenylobacterium immobile TaxID=21 RepID=UPI000B03F47E|nr:TIM44-related membrane protein TimA [Phenylobacterium immobile]
MQALELIIFAGLAGVVLYQLYAVLGRRVGRQPEDQAAADQESAPSASRAPERPQDEGAAVAAATLTGVAAVKARDPGFDAGHFLYGAKQAYEMIVRAFAEGDRAQLRNLLSPQMMDGFEAAITEREREERTERVEFLHPPRADLEKAEVASGDVARLTVRFLAEFRSRSKGPEGEAVDDRRTAELWTFERPLKVRDPNWTLVHVAAAEA